eukprot:jgi/Astpho2/8548/Aster-05582
MAGTVSHYCQDLLYDLLLVVLGAWMINDYFDSRNGVDAINNPSKPLQRRAVTPETMLFLSCGILLLAMIIACTFESKMLRIGLAVGVAVAAAYTPLLKPLTGVKNMVVAGMQMTVHLAGAIAVGMEAADVLKMTKPCLFVFTIYLSREMVCDIQDVEGDRAGHVWTLPVLFGRGTGFDTFLGKGCQPGSPYVEADEGLVVIEAYFSKQFC